MADLGRLCSEQKHESFTASSYDRSGGNIDKGGFIRRLPNGRAVLAESSRPGCIQRIWGTNAGKGDTLFIYLDGSSQASVVRDLGEMVSGSKTFPFVEPFHGSRRSFSYLPIPYRDSMRVEATISKGVYYQIGWREFSRRRDVESFSTMFDEALSNQIVEGGAAWLRNRDGQEDYVYDWTEENVVIPAGRSCRVALAGEGVIRRLELSPSLPAGSGVTAENLMLRSSVLRVFWNGEERPSVAVPLGAFFSNPWRMLNFDSQPFSSSNGTLTCRFPMLFTEGAAVDVENRGSMPMSLRLRAGVTGLPDVRRSDLRYFHASWSSSYDDGRRRIPHTVLTCRGNGHYVGCSMTVESGERSFMILEGDETIRVDGRKDPLCRGTGLEDYFNGAWYYFRGLSDFPWHGLLERVPYRTLQYRFHVKDSVPFERSFDMTFERGDRIAARPMANTVPGRLESIAYFYLDSPASVSEEGLAAVDPARCRIHPAELMSMLLTLERAGKFLDASRLCQQFTEDYPANAYGGVVRLRMQLYDALSGRLGVDRASVLRVAASAPDTRVANEARALLASEQEAGIALVGVQASTPVTAYLDGREIGSATNYAEFLCADVVMSCGTHSLGLELTPSGNERWVTAVIGSGNRRLGGLGDDDFCDAGWKASSTMPMGWPGVEGMDAAKRAKCWPGTGLPREPFFVFEPNAFTGLQAGPVMVVGADPRQRDKVIYLVKTFEW